MLLRSFDFSLLYIYSSLFLDNRISSLLTEIYSYCRNRAWLYCNVFNKEHNIVILFTKWGQNSDQSYLTVKYRH